ncbi:MAG: peptidylprolyl isomerase [Patescibacteria group bacterium]
MKKLFFISTILMIVLSVTACSKENSSETDKNVNQNSEESVNQAPELSAEESGGLKENSPVVTPDLIQNNNSAAAASAIAPSGETIIKEAPASSQPVSNNESMSTPDNQSDLLKQYSQALIKTNYGDIKVKFYGADSPVTVNNFLNLAKAGFYNGTKFHRVIRDFMIQGGDPLSRGSDVSVYGTGGPGYRFKDEFNNHKLVIGSLAMANSGADTNGSQFFIVTAAETPWLDGHHTNFGEVVSGLEIVKKIGAVETGANDRPVAEVIINSIELLK